MVIIVCAGPRLGKGFLCLAPGRRLVVLRLRAYLPNPLAQKTGVDFGPEEFWWKTTSYRPSTTIAWGRWPIASHIAEMKDCRSRE